MSGSSSTSILRVVLDDDVTKPAKSVAQALRQTEKQAQAVAKAFAGSGASDRFLNSLSKLGVAGKDLEVVAKAWRDVSGSTDFASKSTRQWENQFLDATRSAMRGQRQFLDMQREAFAAAKEKEEAVIAGAEREVAALAHAAVREAAIARQRQEAVSRAAAQEAAAVEHAQERRRHAIARGGAGHMLMTGAGAAVSAHGVYHGIEHVIKAGVELQHERIALVNAGQGEHMAEIEARAREVAKSVPTSTVAENLKVINETVGAFGTLKHAIENLDFMQKTSSVLHAAAGDKIHADAGELGYQFAKFFEIRGSAGNSEVFKREAAEMVRAMAFTRGNFNPMGMLRFAQQTESLLPNYSMRFLGKIAPSLITEMGEKAGTRANAWANVIMGKARDQKQAKAWMDYGLLDPKQADMKKGVPVAWRPGAIKDTQGALADPLKWTEDTLIPALQKHGVDTNNNFELTKALNLLFRNSEANRYATAITQLQSRQRLHKDEANIEQAGSLDDIYQRNLNQDPTVAFTALTAAIENLSAAASSPAMKGAAEAITNVAGALQSLAAVAQDHPIAAMTGAGVTGTAALGGAGYLSYQFMTGFGMKDAAAVMLEAANIQLTAATEANGGSVAGAAAKGGLLATLVGAGLPVAIAAGLAAYMAKHGFGHVDPKDYEHNDYKNLDSLPGLDDGGGGDPAPASATPRAGETFGGVKLKADETRAAFDKLNATKITPVVDTSGLAQAGVAADALLAKLLAIQGAAKGAASAAAGIKVPSLGAVNRASFQASGDPGR